MLPTFILDLLQTSKFLPSFAMCKRSSRIGLFFTEASKYWVFLRSLRGNISRISNGEPIPLQEIPDLERTFNRQLETGDGLQAAYWTDIKQGIREKMHDAEDHGRYVRFGEQLTSLTWFYLLAVPTSSVVSWISKTRSLWYFRFLDLMLCAAVVRQLFAISPQVELAGFPSLRRCEAQSWMENDDRKDYQHTSSGEGES
jgi:hypothetical protein